MEQREEHDLAVIGQEVIRQCQFLCLATASAEGQPWASPVMFFADKHYRLYWVSAVEAVHSQNIRATGRVSVAIYNSRPIPGKARPSTARARRSKRAVTTSTRHSSSSSACASPTHRSAPATSTGPTSSPGTRRGGSMSRRSLSFQS